MKSNIQESFLFFAPLTLLLLGLDVLLVNLLLFNGSLRLTVTIFLRDLFPLLLHLLIFLHLHFGLVAFLHLCLSAQGLLHIGALLSVVSASLAPVVLVKYLVVLFLLHLLNINIALFLCILLARY